MADLAPLVCYLRRHYLLLHSASFHEQQSHLSIIHDFDWALFQFVVSLLVLLVTLTAETQQKGQEQFFSFNE